MTVQYTHSTNIHNTRAAEIVVPHLLRMFPVQSVLDVGCGLGTWLAVFQEQGVTDVLGLDGSNVDRRQLQITEPQFKEWDLRRPFDLGRRFDLVLCLEVAEHLPAAYAEEFVMSLCRHSDRIIFSAAVPGQRGQYHVNEQWVDYWRSKFRQRGYELSDAIRPLIWDDDNVDVWYRQNMFFYTKDENIITRFGGSIQMAEVHPALWKMKTDMLDSLTEEVNGFDKGNAGIKRSFKALVNALRNRLWRKR